MLAQRQKEGVMPHLQRDVCACWVPRLCLLRGHTRRQVPRGAASHQQHMSAVAQQVLCQPGVGLQLQVV